MELGHRVGHRQVRDPDGEDQGSKFRAEDGGEVRSRAARSLLLQMSAAETGGPPVHG